jgi:hypothetical protein
VVITSPQQALEFLGRSALARRYRAGDRTHLSRRIAGVRGLRAALRRAAARAGQPHAGVLLRRCPQRRRGGEARLRRAELRQPHRRDAVPGGARAAHRPRRGAGHPHRRGCGLCHAALRGRAAAAHPGAGGRAPRQHRARAQSIAGPSPRCCRPACAWAGWWHPGR